MNYRSDIDDELILQGYGKGKSYRELARQYKCSPNTIRTRYRKALQKQLERNIIDDEYDEDDGFTDIYDYKTNTQDLLGYYDTFMEISH